MNLLGHDFFVFKNVDTDNISVVYKRKDNNYGIMNIKYSFVYISSFHIFNYIV